MNLIKLTTIIILSAVLSSCGKSNDGDWFLDYKKSFGTTEEELKKIEGGIFAVAIIGKFIDTVSIKGNSLEIKDEDKKIISKCVINKINEQNGVECTSQIENNNSKKVSLTLLLEDDVLKIQDDEKKLNLYLTKTKQDPKELYKNLFEDKNAVVQPTDQNIATTIEATLKSYSMGDNQWLTVTDSNGKEINGLCWDDTFCNELDENTFAQKYGEKKAKILLTQGKPMDYSGGEVPDSPAFTKIEILSK
jgi:hypothetical protein